MHKNVHLLGVSCKAANAHDVRVSPVACEGAVTPPGRDRCRRSVADALVRSAKLGAVLQLQQKTPSQGEILAPQSTGVWNVCGSAESED